MNTIIYNRITCNRKAPKAIQSKNRTASFENKNVYQTKSTLNLRSEMDNVLGNI